MSDVPSQSAATELTRSPANELITSPSTPSFEVAALREHKVWIGFQNWLAPFSGHATTDSPSNWYPAYSPYSPQTGCPYPSATPWFYDGIHYPSLAFRQNCRRRFATAATSSTNPGSGNPDVGNTSMSTTLSTYGRVTTTGPGAGTHIPFMTVYEDHIFIPALTSPGNVSTTQTWSGATGSDALGDTGTITLSGEVGSGTNISAMNVRLRARSDWPAWTGVNNNYQTVDEEFYEWGGGFTARYAGFVLIPEQWMNLPDANLQTTYGGGNGWNDVFTSTPDGHNVPAVTTFPEGYVRTFNTGDNILGAANPILWSGWFHPSWEEWGGFNPTGSPVDNDFGSSIDYNYDIWGRRTRVKFLNGGPYYILKATIKNTVHIGPPLGIIGLQIVGPPAGSYSPTRMLGSVSVVQSGSAAGGDVVEIPFPQASFDDFRSIDDTLSYGELYFMLLGETPEQWATRNGITLIGGSPGSGAAQEMKGGMG